LKKLKKLKKSGGTARQSVLRRDELQYLTGLLVADRFWRTSSRPSQNKSD